MYPFGLAEDMSYALTNLKFRSDIIPTKVRLKGRSVRNKAKEKNMYSHLSY